MFSMQNRLCKGNWFVLLEKSAHEAQTSVKTLTHLLQSRERQKSLTPLIESRRTEKRITKQLTEELLTTFLTPFERQDVEALSEALYKIPKTAEKFAERYVIAERHASTVDLSAQMLMLQRAADLVVLLVAELRTGPRLEKTKSKNDDLQRIESEADDLMLSSLARLYAGDHSDIRIIILKDLYELLERIFDRCRDAGNIVFNIAIKYS
jgi:uncharacterized protein Yka (UPF0111/DUF47 family)